MASKKTGVTIPRVNKPGNPAFKKHGNGYAQFERQTAHTLGDAAKVRRRKFVAHYIKTTNATAAATFAGFSCPANKGKQLLMEPYVQQLIQEALSKIELDALMTQQEILFRFKEEANNFEAGNQGARIAALAHMAKIQGMMVERHDVTVSSGVMLVPMVQDADAWGEVAATAQRKLKDQVKD